MKIPQIIGSIVIASGLLGCGAYSRKAEKQPQATPKQPEQASPMLAFNGSLELGGLTADGIDKDNNPYIFRNKKYLKVDPKWVESYEERQGSKIISFKDGVEKEFVSELTFVKGNIDNFLKTAMLCPHKETNNAIVPDDDKCEKLPLGITNTTNTEWNLFSGAYSLSNIKPEEGGVLRFRIVTKDESNKIYLNFPEGSYSLL